MEGMQVGFLDAQREVDGWISQFEEGYFKPMTLIVRLAEEVGELAREVNHHHGEKPKKAEEPEGSIAGEICDTMFVLLSLANSLEIDLDAAFSATMEKYRTRDADRWTPRKG
jgi:NTP pyrophosphatase (non-canonical NTP hydrolase)